MAKMEPSLSLEGSKLGSLPVLADQEALTSGTQPLGAGCLQPSTYCDHTGTAAMGARAAPTDKSITPLINSIFLQLKQGGKQWELCCSAALQRLCEHQLDAGPRPDLAEGTAAAQPHSRAHSLGQDTALQAMSNAEGAECLWGGLFFFFFLQQL